MSEGGSFDKSKADAFVKQVLGDTGGWTATVLSAIGDRLGLFKNLASGGPATALDLAHRTGLQPRYVQEWAAGMVSAGYLAYEPASTRFSLPPEHAPVLAEENGRVFFGGAHQMMIGLAAHLEEVCEAFRTGGGLTLDRYNPHVWEGMERYSGSVHETRLVQQFIAGAGEVQRKLEQGALVADLGCGRGRSTVKLARSFPNATFVGYDLFAPSIVVARAHAAAGGVEQRVTFRTLDVSRDLPHGKYDVALCVDVLHDVTDPVAFLRGVRAALKPDGRFLCIDVNCAPTLEEQGGPMDTMRYGLSLLYCMTTSLAHGGVGLGTMGLSEPVMRELCARAGFSAVETVPLRGPYSAWVAAP
ncbi:MAG: SAM-dependent methyltransferase [Dehalococcoidia bacterium]|nr:SAM-dependent methyltransferase [Dehalococcoidia bacterium]